MTTFDNLDRDAPALPRETCPYINEVISTIDTSVRSIREEIEVLDALTGTRSELEKLRQMNAELRECADYWREAAQAQADEIDRLNKQVDELTARVPC